MAVTPHSPARRSTAHAPLAAIAAAACLLAAGCAGTAKKPQEGALPASDAATLAALDAALAGDHRAQANKARDAYRHPKETLAFFGLRQDMTVMEIWPGAGGWYTEVIAPVVRDKGRYIAAGWDAKLDNKFIQDGVKAYQAKLDARPDVFGKVQVTALQFPTAMQPVPAGSVDMVVTFRNIHNWMGRDSAKQMFEAMFAALKPGGILGVVEHRAGTTAPQDPKAASGYVREDYAIELAKSVGFEFVAASEINANPKDTKDYDQGVWTLPPTLRLGDRDRDRFLAIGESDRFTLRFRKPAAQAH
ncbi:MAG: class I SAM-dependent methyltransferase [Steroidobacteraceae bacterium]|nr:class I SAM-dependent methyltransferase [Steroidobacteraceae bacterium]MCC7200142.1 class I SAM-dependent methyltransferase [Gammaproteobacteria bacterium]